MSKRHKRKVQRLAQPPRPTTGELLNSEPFAIIGWFDTFDGHNPYSFLSNFHIGEPIELLLRWGTIYPDHELLLRGIDPRARITGMTGEHLFAAWKTLDLDHFLWVLEAPDPSTAKSRGRMRNLRYAPRVPMMRSDWEAIKLDVMAMVLEAKFTLDRKEGQQLLDTGDALLVEGTYWNDRVWGVALEEDAVNLQGLEMSYGRNWLGGLLMKRRAELKAERLFGTKLHMREVSVSAFVR